jgi:hypothetical protein
MAGIILINFMSHLISEPVCNSSNSKRDQYRNRFCGYALTLHRDRFGRQLALFNVQLPFVNKGVYGRIAGSRFLRPTALTQSKARNASTLGLQIRSLHRSTQNCWVFEPPMITPVLHLPLGRHGRLMASRNGRVSNDLVGCLETFCTIQEQGANAGEESGRQPERLGWVVV